MILRLEGFTHALTDRGSSITTFARAVTGTRSGCSLILKGKTTNRCNLTRAIQMLKWSTDV